jgi:hypothetical protein
MADVKVTLDKRIIWERPIDSGLGQTLDGAIKSSIPNIKFNNVGSQDVPGGERWGVDEGFFLASGRRLYFIKFYIGSLMHVYLVDGDPTEHLEHILPELKRLKKVKKVMEA